MKNQIIEVEVKEQNLDFDPEDVHSYGDGELYNHMEKFTSAVSQIIIGCYSGLSNFLYVFDYSKIVHDRYKTRVEIEWGGRSSGAIGSLPVSENPDEQEQRNILDELELNLFNALRHFTSCKIEKLFVREKDKEIDEFEVGNKYLRGFYTLYEKAGIPHQNLSETEIKRGIEFLMLADLQGSNWAANRIGDLYFKGEFVPQDYEEAKFWFHIAAQKDNPAGLYMLGEYFYYGIGYEIDYEKAARYYLRALNPCYMKPFLKLADMCVKGEFLPQDLNYARILLEFLKMNEEFSAEGDEREFSFLYTKNNPAMNEIKVLSKGDGVDKTQLPEEMRKELLKILEEIIEEIEKRKED